jgi:acyl-coenzyme A synthetase/AMP-(fatty) acid ligase
LGQHSDARVLPRRGGDGGRVAPVWGPGGAAQHDVYVKIMDRSKDISGGENISTVEAALFTHPAVAEATLVG